MTLHQRIMRAAARGTGMRLSAEEVAMMAQDHAISEAAQNDDDEADDRALDDCLCDQCCERKATHNRSHHSHGIMSFCDQCDPA